MACVTGGISFHGETTKGEPVVHASTVGAKKLSEGVMLTIVPRTGCRHALGKRLGTVES